MIFKSIKSGFFSAFSRGGGGSSDDDVVTTSSNDDVSASNNDDVIASSNCGGSDQPGDGPGGENLVLVFNASPPRTPGTPGQRLGGSTPCLANSRKRSGGLSGRLRIRPKVSRRSDDLQQPRPLARRDRSRSDMGHVFNIKGLQTTVQAAADTGRGPATADHPPPSRPAPWGADPSTLSTSRAGQSVDSGCDDPTLTLTSAATSASDPTLTPDPTLTLTPKNEPGTAQSSMSDDVFLDTDLNNNSLSRYDGGVEAVSGETEKATAGEQVLDNPPAKVQPGPAGSEDVDKGGSRPAGRDITATDVKEVDESEVVTSRDVSREQVPYHGDVSSTSSEGGRWGKVGVAVESPRHRYNRPSDLWLEGQAAVAQGYARGRGGYRGGYRTNGYSGRGGFFPGPWSSTYGRRGRGGGYAYQPFSSYRCRGRMWAGPAPRGRGQGWSRGGDRRRDNFPPRPYRHDDRRTAWDRRDDQGHGQGQGLRVSSASRLSLEERGRNRERSFSARHLSAPPVSRTTSESSPRHHRRHRSLSRSGPRDVTSWSGRGSKIADSLRPSYGQKPGGGREPVSPRQHRDLGAPRHHKSGPFSPRVHSGQVSPHPSMTAGQYPYRHKPSLYNSSPRVSLELPRRTRVYPGPASPRPRRGAFFSSARSAFRRDPPSLYQNRYRGSTRYAAGWRGVSRPRGERGELATHRNGQSTSEWRGRPLTSRQPATLRELDSGSHVTSLAHAQYGDVEMAGLDVDGSASQDLLVDLMHKLLIGSEAEATSGSDVLSVGGNAGTAPWMDSNRQPFDARPHYRSHDQRRVAMETVSGQPRGQHWPSGQALVPTGGSQYWDGRATRRGDGGQSQRQLHHRPPGHDSNRHGAEGVRRDATALHDVAGRRQHKSVERGSRRDKGAANQKETRDYYYVNEAQLVSRPPPPLLGQVPEAPAGQWGHAHPGAATVPGQQALPGGFVPWLPWPNPYGRAPRNDRADLTDPLGLNTGFLDASQLQGQSQVAGQGQWAQQAAGGGVIFPDSQPRGVARSQHVQLPPQTPVITSQLPPPPPFPEASRAQPWDPRKVKVSVLTPHAPVWVPRSMPQCSADGQFLTGPPPPLAQAQNAAPCVFQFPPLPHHNLSPPTPGGGLSTETQTSSSTAESEDNHEEGRRRGGRDRPEGGQEQWSPPLDTPSGFAGNLPVVRFPPVQDLPPPTPLFPPSQLLPVHPPLYPSPVWYSGYPAYTPVMQPCPPVEAT